MPNDIWPVLPWMRAAAPGTVASEIILRRLTGQRFAFSARLSSFFWLITTLAIRSTCDRDNNGTTELRVVPRHLMLHGVALKWHDCKDFCRSAGQFVASCHLMSRPV